MGRKSRKKKEKWSLDNPRFKARDMPELSPELMEQFEHNYDLTPEELQEIEECIMSYGYYLFMDIDDGAPGGGYNIISEETIIEIYGFNLDQEEVLYDRDLVKACLTAEALKKDCVNLLFYVRLLVMCIKDIDFETLWPILVDPVERDRIKRYKLTELTFNKCGIYVNFGRPMSTMTKTMTFEFDDI